MYELCNGAHRLASALECVKEDKQTMQILSRALNYHPEQLVQDIQAINDYVNRATITGKE